LYRSGRKNR